jgi:hypothetical protein
VLVATAGVLCVELLAHTPWASHHVTGLSTLNRVLAAYCLTHLGVDLLRHGPEGYLEERAADTAVYLPHAALVTLPALGLAAGSAWATWAEPACGAACVWRELVALDLLLGSELVRRLPPLSLGELPVLGRVAGD